MKKTNNKGFSLVELIIVIAIMAILAGAIAPALIKYIDKSRKSNDVTSAKTIKTAVETALGNESVYELITIGASKATDGFCYIDVEPGQPTGSSSGSQTCINIRQHATTDDVTGGKINGKTIDQLLVVAKDAIGQNIGEKTPKIKYRKNAKGSNDLPKEFVVAVSKGGTVYVFISTANDNSFTCSETDGVVETTKGFQLCPNICDEYQ